MDIGIGSYVTLQKDLTEITGMIDGIKVNEHGLERVSIANIDIWFWMSSGWKFAELVEEVEDGEI
jgi:hypothetical protein